MALAKGAVNALNVLGSRKLNFIPAHFATMTVNPANGLIDSLDFWVYQNLNSRYSIIRTLKVDENNRIISVYEIGVEDAKELTMLSLACPFLNKNK